MTVATTSNEIDFTGISTAPLTFPNPVHAAGELYVYIVDADGVEALRTAITDYAIALALDLQSATVTPTAGLVTAATGKTLRLRRTIPLSQSLDLANAARLNSAGIDKAFDRATMGLQQLNTRIGKAESSLDDAELASASADEAAASALAAAASALAADASADAAAVSAQTATDKATAASGSASAAAASNSAAGASAVDAAGSASAAAASAVTSTNSATTSTNAKIAAAISAAAALVSENNSAANLDSFFDVYLGPHAVDPTDDNDGNPLQEGQLYLNSVSKELKVFGGTTWSAILSGGLITSVFGRAGAVAAVAGDYSASKISNDSGVSGAFVDDALDALGSGLNAVSSSAVQTLTNKSINASSNTITNLILSMFASGVIDVDGRLAANSDTKLATQKATKTAIAAAIAALVASSPGTLDTLDELAAALGDDPNFATTIATNIGLKAAKASNLSDLASATTALTNLGLSANGKSLVTAANYAAMITLLGVREVLTANRTYYVDKALGNNSNDGRASGSGRAFATVQKAIDTACGLDLNIYSVTINVADGTGYAAFGLKSYVGVGPINIIGNTTTPANVDLSGSSTNITGDGWNCAYVIKGMKVASSAGNGMAFIGPGTAALDNIEFGACTVAHIRADNNCLVSSVWGHITISGNAGFGYLAGYGATIDLNNCTITYSANVAYATAHAYGQVSGIVNVQSVTFTLGGFTVTGKRYNSVTGGYASSNGAGATFIPGNVAGTGTYY